MRRFVEALELYDDEIKKLKHFLSSRARFSSAFENQKLAEILNIHDRRGKCSPS